MTSIGLLAGGSGVQQTSQNSNSRLQAAIARLVGLPGLFPTGDSVSGLSTVARLQAQNADIRQISGNIVQALSLSQVAEASVSDIQQAVSSLQALAQQASQPDLNAQARNDLNTRFQQVASQINQLALSSNFNGRALLDGSLSGSGSLSLETVISGNNVAGGSGDLSIANLSTQGLFDGNLDISTAEGAGQSLSSLATAVDRLASVREDINVFQLALDYASANVDTVLANQVAAESAIREGEPVSTNVQQNVSNALAAQGNQLSPTLLQLIS